MRAITSSGTVATPAAARKHSWGDRELTIRIIRAMAVPDLDRCLDDESAAWFVGGHAREHDRQRVESHLDDCAACRRRIAALALASPPVQSFVALDGVATEPAEDDATIRARRRAPAGSTPPRADAGIPGLGERVGRYVVLRTLGRGGMGVVVAAHDPELDRQVAIKLVHPALWRTASHEARELLRQEARAMARLVHPNVVAVHDLGTIRDQLFVAMELVAGTSLDGWLAKGPRPWREVLAVCIEAGRGIAAAHRAGLVHRDVKPHNVLVDAEGRTRIADFGLAVLAQGDVATESSPAGTPAYMSPEQHRCDATGPASDQFSFCVMVYEALFGMRPFGGRSVAEVATEVLEGRVRPLPPRSRVPRAVRRALLRGLAVDPEQRFPTMDALLDALAPRPVARRAVTASLGVVAAGAITVALIGRNDRDPAADARAAARSAAAAVWGARERAAVTAGLVRTGHRDAAATASAVIAIVDRFVDRWIEARVLVAQRNRAGDDPVALATRRADCLDRRLAELGALVVALRDADAVAVPHARDGARYLTPISVCTEGSALADRLPPPVEPDRRARVDALEAEIDRIMTLNRIGKPKEASLAAEQVVARARELNHPPLTAEALYAYGGTLGTLGETGRAEKTLEESLTEVAHAHDDELAGRIWVRLIGIAAAAGEVERCRALATGAAAAIERAKRAELRVWLEDALGTAANAAGDLVEGERRHRAALQLALTVDGIDQADRGYLMLHVAGDLVDAGRLDEAHALIRDGRALAAREHGEHSPYLLLFDNEEALAFQAAGDFEHMLEVAQRGEAFGDPGSMGVFATYLHGTALHGLGRVDEALPLERSAVEQFVQLGDRQREYEARYNYGVGLYALDQYAEAAVQIERTIEIAQQIFPATDLRRGETHTTRGLIAIETADLDRARAECRLAVEAFTAAVGGDDDALVIPLVCISRVDRMQGRPREALPRVRDAVRIAEKFGNPSSVLNAYDELSMELDATGDRAAAKAALAKAIVAGQASGEDTAELRERQTKWQRRF